MGICASCLGGGQPREDPAEQEQDEVESGPLLFSVPNGMHYGSFAEPQMMAPQCDPSRTQRETEALQRVAARTSDALVDVYYDNNTTPGAYSRHNQGSVRDRKAQYQYVLTKVDSNSSLSTDEEYDEPLRGGFTQGEFTHVKADSTRKLVGSFREAAAAMA